MRNSAPAEIFRNVRNSASSVILLKFRQKNYFDVYAIFISNVLNLEIFIDAHCTLTLHTMVIMRRFQ